MGLDPFGNPEECVCVGAVLTTNNEEHIDIGSEFRCGFLPFFHRLTDCVEHPELFSPFDERGDDLFEKTKILSGLSEDGPILSSR